MTFLDKRLSTAGALTEAEQLAPEHATVLIPAEFETETMAVLMNELDRVVVLVGDAAEAGALARLFDATERGRLEVILVGEEAEAASKEWRPGPRELVVRVCARQSGYPLSDDDVAWIARHLTRTKLGLALGAGGAKGYAHVGVLQVVEEAGYTVDFVGGSSIGGFVASHVALGYDANEATRDSAARSTPRRWARSSLIRWAATSRCWRGCSARQPRSVGSPRGIPLVIMAADLPTALHWRCAAVRSGRRSWQRWRWPGSSPSRSGTAIAWSTE